MTEIYQLKIPKCGSSESLRYYENKAKFLYKSHINLDKAVAAGKALDGGLKKGRFHLQQWLRWFDYQSLLSQGIVDKF